MPIGSRWISSCHGRATVSRTRGFDGSTLPSTPRTILSNGRLPLRLRAVDITPSPVLWSCFSHAWERGQVQGCNQPAGCDRMEGAILEMDRRFALPGVAQVVEGNGRMPKVRIRSPEVGGEIYLHGAHVTSWKPAGREEV